MKRALGLLVVLGAALSCAAAAAEPLACDGGAVDVAASKYEVRTRCGEPLLEDANRVTRVTEGDDAVLQEFVDVEDWLYDFGPDRLVMVLTFEKDALVGMRTLGYGRARTEPPDLRKVVEKGVPAVWVLFLYGPPSDKEERIETTVLSTKDGGAFPKQVSVSTWTYNRGPDRFMKILHFVEGRLSHVEQGPRGF